MRLSTSSMYQQSLSALLNQQSALNRTQNQVSTSQRINVASDDPAGAGRVVTLNHILAANTQYTSNIDAASTRLNSEQSALGAVNSLLDNARTLALQGGNGSLATSDRKAIAGQLTQLRDQLVQLANGSDSNGDALFAGTSTTSAPFTPNADGSVSYIGNNSALQASIGVGLKTPTGDAGGAVFMDIPAGNGSFSTSAAPGNTGTLVVGDNSVSDPAAFKAASAGAGGGSYSISFDAAGSWSAKNASGAPVLDAGGNAVGGSYKGGDSISFNGLTIGLSGTPTAGDSISVASGGTQDVFSTLNQMIGALQGDGSDAQLSNTLNRQIESLDQAQSSVTRTEVAIGGRLNTLTTQKSVYGDLSVAYKSSLGDVQGLDLYTAISTLTQQSTALQASQQVFAQVKSLSLFNYIK